MLHGKEYQAYKVEDFLGDESFVNWAKNKSDDQHWQQVFLQYPDLLPHANEAKMWIAQVVIAVDEAPLSEHARFNQKLKHSIELAEQKTKVWRLPVTIKRIAAVFIAVMVIAAAVGAFNYFSYEHFSTAPPSYSNQIHSTRPPEC